MRVLFVMRFVRLQLNSGQSNVITTSSLGPTSHFQISILSHCDVRMGIHKLRRGQFHFPNRSPSAGNRIICGIYQNGNARGCVLPFAHDNKDLLSSTSSWALDSLILILISIADASSFLFVCFASVSPTNGNVGLNLFY